ncbi:ribosome recycling factor [Clostridiales bacterium KA00134]|nr:ribosome recycling factor [Clostridiales bacterium KA00134]
MIKDLTKISEDRMKKTISVYSQQLASIRAGRANPALLNNLSVQYYGQMTPLNQVAGISAPEPRLITISPWDVSLIPEIEKEILKSDLGLTPSNDGKIIRLNIPQLTEERRLELTKVVRKNGEDAKIAIRNVRREMMDEIKKAEKDKEITEDEKRTYEDDAQKLTDKYIDEVDRVTAEKEAELLEI